MENKNLSEKDLDKLLNQAFLGLDFNEPKNSQVIESIAEHTLTTKVVPSTLQKIFLNKLFLSLVSLGVICAIAFYFIKTDKVMENKSANNISSSTISKDSIKITIQEVVWMWMVILLISVTILMLLWIRRQAGQGLDGMLTRELLIGV